MTQILGLPGAQAPLGGHLWHLLALAAWFPIFGVMVVVERMRGRRRPGPFDSGGTVSSSTASLIVATGAFAETRGRDSASRAVVSVEIGGMTCGSCAARIERRLNDLDGVEASVNYAAEKARVTVDDLDLPIEVILGEIRAAGFSAPEAGDLVGAEKG
ncbi:MAG: heavy-metal-associated domain-containing protein, partial [Acidimicrobiales bacterium]